MTKGKSSKGKNPQETVTVPREDWELVMGYVKVVVRMLRGDVSSIQAGAAWMTPSRKDRLIALAKQQPPKAKRRGHRVLQLELVTK